MWVELIFFCIFKKVGQVGDAFMNQIQPIAGYLPYMTCVGNHEQAYNFSNYVNRFSMPRLDSDSVGGDNNHFYSINIGPVHLIGFSTEFYYFFQYGLTQVQNQYNWLENDLKVIFSSYDGLQSPFD